MKLGRKHLVASLALLVSALAWNVWVFTRPATSTVNRGGSLAAPAAPDPMGRAPEMADPRDIPAPPPVDPGTQPVWPRNPFQRPNVTAMAEESQAAPAPPRQPVVRAILYSADRRVAIVDGKVAGLGDRVGAALVVDITRDAVVVELPSGERERWPLRSPGPTVIAQ